MRKIRKISFFGILGILTAILFLAGISFMQAQVQIQKKPENPGKPDKPNEPQATWAASIPTGEDTMLFGDGYDYIDGSENIEVTVEKNKAIGPGKTANDFYSYIGFKISHPTSRHVDFEGVSLGYLDPEVYDCVDPDIGFPCCVFPLSSNDCSGLVSNQCAEYACTCMEDFINNDVQPHSDYSFFLIELYASDIDLLTMLKNDPYQLGQEGHLGDCIQMEFRYQTGKKEPIYHNIYCSKSAHLGEASIHPFNIWITRTGENTWTIDVGKKDFPDQQFLFLEEYYFEKGNRFYSTLFQGGYFYFAFDLIRIPPSN